MSQRANYFKLGVFILSAFAILVAGLIVFGAGALLQKGMVMETYIDQSVQGLDVGSPVKYRGVQVGSVSDIGFVKDYYPEITGEAATKVLIRAELNRAFFAGKGIDNISETLAREVERGLRVRLAPQGITGLNYLEVDYLLPESYPVQEISWDPDELYVPSAKSFITQIGDSVEQLAMNMRQVNIDAIADKIDVLISTINQSVEDAKVKELSEQSVQFIAETRETNKRIQEILSNPQFNTIPNEAAKSVEAVNRILAQTEEDMITLLKEFSESVDSMQKVLEGVGGVVESEELKQGIADAAATAANARAATEDLPQTVAQVDRTLRRMERIISDQQRDLDAIIKNMREITENMKTMTDNTSEYPSLLLFGEPPTPYERPGK